MERACTHRHLSGRASEDAELLRRRAEARCVAAGVRWTVPHDRVFQLLAEASGPLGSYDLIHAYRPGGRGNPTTVHESLRVLIACGLVQRVEISKRFVVCEEGYPSDTLFVCKCCGQVSAAQLGLEPAVTERANSLVFAVSRFALEVSGHCEICAT